MSGHVQRAGQWLRGTFDFTELYGEVRGYVPIGSRIVWANRLGSATLAGPSAALIPFYKRYFVGRLGQRSRMGTLPGESADARRGAYWRAHHDGGLD